MESVSIYGICFTLDHLLIHTHVIISTMSLHSKIVHHIQVHYVQYSNPMMSIEGNNITDDKVQFLHFDDMDGFV